MSPLDVIFITPDVFELHRHGIAEYLSPKFLSCALDILKRFDCFQNSVNTNVNGRFANSNGGGHGHHYHRKSHLNNHSCHSKNTLNEIVKKNIENMHIDENAYKAIIGCLNKITTSNMAKLSVRIAHYLRTDNSKEFVNIMNNRCSNEADFISLYLTAMHIIRKEVGSNSPVWKTIEKEFTNMLNNWDFIPDDVKDVDSGEGCCKSDDTKYEIMVQQVSIKKHISNRLKMLLVFGNMNTGFFQGNFKQMIGNAMSCAQDKHLCIDRPYSFEVFLIQLKQLVLHKKDMNGDIDLQKFKHVLEDTLTENRETINSRLRFIVMDLCDLLTS